MRKQVVGAREMVFLISPVRGRRADLTGAMKDYAVTTLLKNTN
ncbi:MAG TPA: hypothetical protein P5070_10295 [Bacteroidia bacterium]|nr:hypothetical protein [Bacteroidia bacterium]